MSIDKAQIIYTAYYVLSLLQKIKNYTENHAS